MKEAIILSSKHNYAALIDLCRGIESKGYWKHLTPIHTDVAATVGYLFESIAWSDRSLHRYECKVLDALMVEDEALGGTLALTFSILPDRSDGLGGVPEFIKAAQRMDQATGSAIAPILVNQLESLVLLIAHADDRIDEAEVRLMSEIRKNWTSEHAH